MFFIRSLINSHNTAQCRERARIIYLEFLGGEEKSISK